MRKLIILLIVNIAVITYSYSQNRPTASDNTVSTDEDVDKVFTQSDFNYSDADGDPFYKVYISSNVSRGTLYFDDNLNGVIDAGEALSSGDEVFTSDFNKFKFKPEPNENGSSYTSFDFKVHDGKDGYSWGTYTMTIDVNPVNDPPVVTTNTGITVDEGSSGNQISQSNLETTDIDNTASDLTYTISTAPSHGTLYRSGSPLSNGSTFTQDDINNNRITYDHDGSETTSDSFTFDVDDGNGGSTGSTVFHITINPVNDPPVLTTNTGKTVDEASTGNIILQSELETTDPDNTPSELTYTVTVLPTHGTLKLSGSPLTAGSTFTQADINSNLLTYDHDGSETTSDLFKFTVSDGNGGNIPETQFDITINPQNDPPVVTTNTGMSVDEGSTGNTILQSYLETTDNDNTATELTYTISTAPSHGTLYRSGSPLSNGSTFTQDDINNNRITYDHDGSETTSDSFTFDVDDGNGGSTGSTVFHITINPVNDPPVLTTNTGKSVDEGSTGNIILQSELEATDPDNSASELTYTVTVIPTHGNLKRGAVVLAVGDNFTQSDINSNNISYDHDGSETTSDYFKFTVSDGNGGNIPETQFDITINPVNDPPEFTSTPITSADEGVLYTYNITTHDNDDAGTSLTITAPTLPSWLTLTDNGDGTAVLEGTPPHGVPRDNPVTLRVTDPNGDFTEQSFVIVVSLNIIVPNDYPTIQEGIDAAQDGDIVEVLPGTYTENINFNGKNIQLIGNESDPSQVVIDGNNSGPVVVFENGEPSTAVLSGFTLQNGSGQIGLTSSSTVHAPASGYYGGGILVYESSPTLKNLIIQNNSIQTNNNHGGSGAGIYIYHGNVSIIGDVSTVRIENNNSQVYRGGGICIDMGSHVQLQNVRISNNHAGNYGGGIAVYDSQLDLTNVQILNNTVDGRNGLGGGLYSHNSTVNQNSGVTISGNSATVAGNDFYQYP